MTTHAGEITRYLHEYRQGKREALDQVVPLVYRELHRLAIGFMSREKPGQTLQPTALVNELWIKLSQGTPVDWQDRAHFFAVAATQMRRILISRIREKLTEKRGGGMVRVTLDHADGFRVERYEEILAVHEALEGLSEVDERAARVVEMRFFGDMQEKEIAEVLGVTVPTVKRDWTFARAWLLQQLSPVPATGA